MNVNRSNSCKFDAGQSAGLYALALTLAVLMAVAVNAIAKAGVEEEYSDNTGNTVLVEQRTIDVSETAVSSDAAWQPPVTPSFALPPLVDAETAKLLEEKWGVSLLSLRNTAAGYMLDFRFRVLDVDKALPLFESTIKPMLTVARSNAKLPVPAAAKIGSFRTTNRGKNIKADRNYFIMFANPDRHVKSGDEVSLTIGDFQVKTLKVL